MTYFQVKIFDTQINKCRVKKRKEISIEPEFSDYSSSVIRSTIHEFLHGSSGISIGTHTLLLVT